MSAHAEFSYAPGEPHYPVPTFTRASVATYVDEATDQAFLYWPGELHNAETFTRASTATYVEATRYPA